MVCLKDGNWQISRYQGLAEVGHNPSLVLAFLCSNVSDFRGVRTPLMRRRFLARWCALPSPQLMRSLYSTPLGAYSTNDQLTESPASQ
jgi:hypothetical protein